MFLVVNLDTVVLMGYTIGTHFPVLEPVQLLEVSHTVVLLRFVTSFPISRAFFLSVALPWFLRWWRRASMMSSRPLAFQQQWPRMKLDLAAATLPPVPLGRIPWASAVRSRSVQTKAGFLLLLRSPAASIETYISNQMFYLFRSCSSTETAGVGNRSPSCHPQK